ncbi:DNA-binding transcriptional regulator, LysR family [Ectothiorhodospira marina]|uniref:DNA-binding transcriptional regulator, LysR family n=2 Tax=Ectothiorhodospira marina TaxID=1396821 RepID=A0A1H7P578_9GAMM|nr:LysR family transcriptional regulator [Ectothiorhodospira marina]SEL30425.1 DNA-binding transcriptional regulator, LysR family [Ectothiorhodospira marina]
MPPHETSSKTTPHPGDEAREHPSGPSGTANRFIRHATLRQMQLLEAIVRLGSFTRAAEEMFLTQPTVSMQIKKLSDTVGMPLFLTAGRQVVPTDAGREVHAAVRTILRTLSDLETKLADLKGLKSGRLRLAVITTAKYFAPEILGAFCEKFPGIEVSLKITNRDRIIERMAAHEDDLYIFGEPKSAGMDVEATYLAPNPLVIVARNDHPLTQERRIPLERLAEENFLLRETGSGIRDSLVRRFQEKGLRPRVRMELGSNEAIKHAIVAGLGISALSLHSLNLDWGGGRLAMLDVEGFPVDRAWYLVHPKGRELSTLARTFLAFAIEQEPEIRATLNTTYQTLRADNQAILLPEEDGHPDPHPIHR